MRVAYCVFNSRQFAETPLGVFLYLILGGVSDDVGVSDSAKDLASTILNGSGTVRIIVDHFSIVVIGAIGIYDLYHVRNLVQVMVYSQLRI